MPKCKICGKNFEVITYAHLKWKHGITCQEYKEMFPGAEFNSDKVKKIISERNKKLHAEGRYDHVYEGNKGWFSRLSEEHQERLRKLHADIFIDRWEHDYDEMCRINSRASQAAWDNGKRDYLWSDPDHRKRGLERLANARKCKNNPTDIEVSLYDILNSLEVPYETQVCIGRYTVDALVCSNLVIEADGVYWHSLPEAVEKDIRENEFLSIQDYDILRLSGELLRHQPETCLGTILGFMEAC